MPNVSENSILTKNSRDEEKGENGMRKEGEKVPSLFFILVVQNTTEISLKILEIRVKRNFLVNGEKKSDKKIIFSHISILRIIRQ